MNKERHLDLSILEKTKKILFDEVVVISAETLKSFFKPLDYFLHKCLGWTVLHNGQNMLHVVDSDVQDLFWEFTSEDLEFESHEHEVK